MKQFLLIIVCLFTLFPAFAQTEEEPVVWSHEVEELGEGTYMVTFRGVILDGNWF